MALLLRGSAAGFRYMPPTDGFTGNRARLEARVDWLIRRFEALDARLIALELAAQAPKRPPTRAASLGDQPERAPRPRSRIRPRRARRK